MINPIRNYSFPTFDGMLTQTKYFIQDICFDRVLETATISIGSFLIIINYVLIFLENEHDIQNLLVVITDQVFHLKRENYIFGRTLEIG